MASIWESLIKVNRTTLCWLWTGELNSQGYAIVTRRRSKKHTLAYVHRQIYRMLRGEIPRHYELHHRCFVRNCINPWHMRCVSRRKHKSIHNDIRSSTAQPEHSSILRTETIAKSKACLERLRKRGM